MRISVCPYKINRYIWGVYPNNPDTIPSMTDTISYQYTTPSSLQRAVDRNELFLAKYSEIEKREVPCFFWGKLTQPYITARCLITLSNVVQASFNLTPAQLSMLKDPIVTAGNNRLRFEGFSHCAGVYARVDVLPDGHDGEFPESGTTNVDFNAGMISALNRIGRQESVVMSVGPKEVGLYHQGEKVVERKVPLPVKWIKGLTTVQIYQSVAERLYSFNRIQTLQLFQTLPKSSVKCDYYLVVRGQKPVFSPVKSLNAVCIGGLHRLRLLEPLLPFADELRVFVHPTMQSTTWQLYFGPVRFSLSLSRECWRGFSGEGAALDALIEDIPSRWIEAMDKYSYANQQFNPTLFAIKEHIDLDRVDSLAARLATMGLLGFDLDENSYFYRRLPFKTERIMNLNPRMVAAEKLLEERKVEILSHNEKRTEARVAGSDGVRHTVILDRENGKERCTCTWFSSNQGERGACKHILAVKKSIQWKQ